MDYNKKLTITLLGNNSGRNLGDAAILSGILESLHKKFPNASFLVPSITPSFIDKNYGDQYPVKGINVMPWTGSLRLLGIPTIRAILKSDAALICDGIIFGKGFWNPAFNFLITLFLLLPFFKISKCKLICYNCGIGPFPVPFSVLAARWVMEASDMITLRDEDSEKLALEIGVTSPLLVTGDSAFTNPVSPKERALEIFKENGVSTEKPLLAINVTVYIDSWLKPEERVRDKDLLLEKIANAALDLKKLSSDSANIVLISTQPMDEKTIRKMSTLLDAPIIDNSRYLSHDIQAVIRECDLLVGMRFHSLILASAVEVPVVGMIYAPKVRGYLRLLDCEEFGIELKQIMNEDFSSSLHKAWTTRAELKEKQMSIVKTLVSGAHDAAELLAEKLVA